MKKVFIPKGETAVYDSLYTNCLIVRGVLRVTGKIHAKQIIGGGVIEAGEIICDDMRVSCATANCITARNIAVDKLFVRFECRSSVQVSVRDYLSAGYVSTGNLSVSLSDVGSCDADEVIMVQQRGSLPGFLWASWWRGLFLRLFHGGKSEKTGQKDAVIPAKADASGEQPDDDTIGLIIAVLSDLKDRGYRVSRVDPAENKDVAA